MRKFNQFFIDMKNRVRLLVHYTHRHITLSSCERHSSSRTYSCSLSAV